MSTDTPNNSPYQWTMGKRYAISSVLSLMTFTVTMGASIISPGLVPMQLFFGVDWIVIVLSVSLYVLGLALGAIFLAPLSDSYGRNAIYWPTWGLFILLQIPVALTRDVSTLLICRFLAGLVGSPATTVVAGSLRDIWTGSEMEIPMAIVLFSAFLGPVVGPVAGGYIAQQGEMTAGIESWRWIIWVMLILSSIVGAMLCFVPETARQPHNVHVPNTPRQSWAARAPQSAKVQYSYLTSIRSPLILLQDPVLLLLAVYLSLVYGILFLYFGAYPIVFGTKYGWAQGPSGLAFIGIGVGILLSIPTAALGNQYRTTRPNDTGEHRCINEAQCPGVQSCSAPESRLLLAIVAGILAPASVYWFSWSQFSGTHWLVPVASGVPFGWSMVTLFISMLGYLNEIYYNNPTTCMCSTSFLRYMFAFAFPLFTRNMYETMGAQWAGTLIGCLLAAFAPLPTLFYLYGGIIRGRCAD